MNDVSRRTFLGTSALLAGAAGVGSIGCSPAPGEDYAAARGTESSFGAAKRVIFAVVDGMSMGTLTLGELYARAELGRGTNWVGLLNEPGVSNALCSTSSANALVTDSAAAASAWSIGERVNNGAISHDIHGQPRTPIMVRTMQSGLRCGLVSSSRVTHATPAAFLASVPKRGMEHEIAKQILANKAHVLHGGGAEFFEESDLAASGLLRCTTLDELNELPHEGGTIGLFADGHMPYVLDREAHHPDLLTMTKDAIRRLDLAGDGFLLQVENGGVDHAAHVNDAASVIHEQLDFDQTLGYLIEYTRNRDDTLLVITTDHANANPGLTVMGPEGAEKLHNVTRSKRSFDWIFAEIKRRGSTGRERSVKREIIEFATGFAPDDETLELLDRRATPRADLFGHANGSSSRLGSWMANHNGIGFISGNHAPDYVPLTTLGVGAGLIPNMMSNIDIHPILLHVTGIQKLPSPA